MNDPGSENLNPLQKLSSDLASVTSDLVKVDNAGLPTGELEDRAAGLILELVELNPDLTPFDKAGVKKEIERFGIGKVIKDLGKLYNP